jgi:hypothetical protein
LKIVDVIDVLRDLFILRAFPRQRTGVCRDVGVGASRRRHPRSNLRPPWRWQSSENRFIENLNARLRDELLSADVFFILKEAKGVIES